MPVPQQHRPLNIQTTAVTPTKIKINICHIRRSDPANIEPELPADMKMSPPKPSAPTKSQPHKDDHLQSSLRAPNERAPRPKNTRKTRQRPVIVESSTDESSETTVNTSTYSRSVSSFTTSSSFDPYLEPTISDSPARSTHSNAERKPKPNDAHAAKPMLHIVQEMSQQRVVVSTVHVNRRKVRQWQRQQDDDSPPKDNRRHGTKKQSKQRRIINENFCNEMLDQNLLKNRQEAAPCTDCNRADGRISDEAYDVQQNESAESEGNDDVTLLMTNKFVEPITVGKLQAGSGKKPNRSAGRLMAKRLMRMSTDGRIESVSKRNAATVVAPAKPPRTFHSESSTKSDSSIDNPPPAVQSRPDTCRSIHSALTTPADEIVSSSDKKKAKQSRKLGWILPNEVECIPEVKPSPKPRIFRQLPPGEFEPGWKPDIQSLLRQKQQLQPVKPSCPNLDDISPDSSVHPIGWTPKPFNGPPAPIPQHIVNMLYMDTTHEASVMSSAKMMAQPQVASPPKPLLPPKESIDDVDGHISKHMQRFGSETVFSTPQRHNICNNARLAEERRTDGEASTNLEDSTETRSDDMCVNCHCHKSRAAKQSSKSSFGKIAMRRTKNFFEASKNMLNRSSTTAKNLNQTMREGDPFNNNNNDVDHLSDNESDSRCVTPQKLDTTERLNQQHQSHGKPTVKRLELSRAEQSREVPVESPKRMYEMFLASVKGTPPRKPMRRDIATQNDFDFQRTVSSPTPAPRNQRGGDATASKSSGFLLSPRRLFGKASTSATRRHSLNIEPASGSYKSFIDQEDDGFAIFIAEYLRKMYMKIESDRPIDAVSEGVPKINRQHDVDALAARHDISSSSEDVVGDRLHSPPSNQMIDIDCHPLPEPFYQEIPAARQTQLATVPEATADVYAVVNKTKSGKNGLADGTTAISELLSSKSYDSLCLLNNTNDLNLVRSMENLLEQHFLGLKPKVANEFKSMEELIPGDVEVQPSVHVVDLDDEVGSRKIEHEFRQNSSNPVLEYRDDVPKTPDAHLKPMSELGATIYADCEETLPLRTSTIIDVHTSREFSPEPTSDEPIYMDDASNASTSTYSSIVLTESICDEVLRGQNINDDIFHTMHRLESALNLTEPSAGQSQALPESDDDSDAPAGQRSTDKLSRVKFALNDSSKSLAASPSYKRLTSSLRNSFRRGSQLFQKSERKADPGKGLEQLDEPKTSSPLVRVQSYMQLLSNQTVHQRELQPQLRRAIEVCRNTAGFECSAELVEAERLLLLSQTKEAAAQCEMTRIDYDEAVPVPESHPIDHHSRSNSKLGTAMLEIRRLECSLRPSDVFDMHHKFFYVCVVSYRNQVQATYAQEVDDDKDAPTTDDEYSGGEGVRKLVFDRLGMRFTGLHPNFQVKIEVMMLRLPHWFGGISGSADKSKFRSSKAASESTQTTSRFRSQDSAFVTPTNLWPINTESGMSRRYEFPQCTAVSSSSCIFSSSSQQRLIPFVSSEPHGTGRPTRTTNGQPIRLDYYSEIQLDIPDTKGFLNVARVEPGLPLKWSRQWCWIRGCKLYMSASVKASEQTHVQDSQPTPPSLQTVDLTLCTNGPALSLANNTDSASEYRQYVSIQTASSRSSNHIPSVKAEFRIASDTDQTLRVWLREINHIMQFVYEWRL